MLFTRNPFTNFASIQRQLDQVVEDLAQTGSYNWQPAIEVKETPETYILRAIIPSLDTQELDIQATKNAVAFSGNVPQNEATETDLAFYSEFPSGKFHRVVTLRKPIINTEVKADYKDGILSITLPKAPEAINKVVKVQINGGTLPVSSETNAG